MENSGFSGLGLIIGLIILVVAFIPYVLIIRKAGYSGWWVLTALIPIVGFIMLWVFALARWPIEERAAGVGAEKVF